MHERMTLGNTGLGNARQSIRRDRRGLISAPAIVFTVTQMRASEAEAARILYRGRAYFRE